MPEDKVISEEEPVTEQPPTVGIPSQPGPVSEDELQAFVAESLAKVERAREKMKRDQAEIDQLKAETRSMISKLLAA